MSHKHPLEVMLNASADDILSAVQRGFRAIIDVKGKLAEYYLEKQIAECHKAGHIERYVWQDKDGQPDFLVRFRGREIRLECKNIRSEELFRKPSPAYKVEIQKTRNSKDGTPTRGYGFDEFDVLAACLFNHTKKWEYLFVRTCDLERRADATELMKVMQRVPLSAGGIWKANLLEALEAC